MHKKKKKKKFRGQNEPFYPHILRPSERSYPLHTNIDQKLITQSLWKFHSLFMLWIVILREISKYFGAIVFILSHVHIYLHIYIYTVYIYVYIYMKGKYFYLILFINFIYLCLPHVILCISATFQPLIWYI